MTTEKEIFQYPEEYQKSNVLINAKYNSSLLENKLMAISLSRIQYDKSNNELYAKIKASELKQMLGKKSSSSGSFYTQLKESAELLTGKTIGISDQQNQTFTYIAVVTKSHYENGELFLEFHKDMKPLLLDLKKNYTKLRLEVMLNFKSIYSFRLYEILRSKCFYPKGQERNSNLFRFEILLSELKLELGIVNSELDEVRKILRNNKNPNYDKAVEKSPEKRFETFSEFKRKVLDKATNEINLLSDIRVEYETLTQGKGGKVYAINFTVQLNTIQNKEVMNEKSKPKVNSEEELELIGKVFLLGNGTITMADCKKILEKANFQMEKIETAFDVYKKAKNVTNPVGFIMSALENEWTVSANEIVNNFNNMKSVYKDIDFDSFEQMILEN